MSRLNGRAALITGGRQGIGRAIVDAFMAEGADVANPGAREIQVRLALLAIPHPPARAC